MRMSTYDVLRGGSGAAEVHAVWDGDALPEGAPVVESSPIISDEHLAMLRRLAEDEGKDEEYAEAYVEEIKNILGVEADFLQRDLGSAYLDETNQELMGSAEDADTVSGAWSFSWQSPGICIISGGQGGQHSRQ
jgi:hypothetical protein